MSNELNYLHDTRNASGGGLYQFTGQKVNLPSRGVATPLVGLFNYLGTNRRTVAFANPCYNGISSGLGWGNPTGLVRVSGTNISVANGQGPAVIQTLTDGGGSLFGAGALVLLTFTFDFMSDTRGTLVNGKIKASNFVFKPTSFIWTGVDTTGNTSGAAVAQVSNDGFNWTSLSLLNSSSGNVYVETALSTNKFWRYFRVTPNNFVGEVELYGVIQWVKIQ